MRLLIDLTKQLLMDNNKDGNDYQCESHVSRLWRVSNIRYLIPTSTSINKETTDHGPFHPDVDVM